MLVILMLCLGVVLTGCSNKQIAPVENLTTNVDDEEKVFKQFVKMIPENEKYATELVDINEDGTLELLMFDTVSKLVVKVCTYKDGYVNSRDFGSEAAIEKICVNDGNLYLVSNGAAKVLEFDKDMLIVGMSSSIDYPEDN